MSNRVPIPKRVLEAARLWAEGVPIRDIAVAVERTARQVRRYLIRPEVIAEINRLAGANLALVVPKLVAKGLAAIDRIDEDIATGNESMVRLLQNRSFADPVIRLASMTALSAGKSAAEVGADVRAAEIRRFLAASEEMEAGGDPTASSALPGPPGGAADGG